VLVFTGAGTAVRSDGWTTPGMLYTPSCNARAFAASAAVCVPVGAGGVLCGVEGGLLFTPEVGEPMPGGCVRGAGAEDEPVCAVTGLVCPEKMKYSSDDEC